MHSQAGLQPLPSFIEKSIQLYEMVVVRHGLMLVGQVCGGGGGRSGEVTDGARPLYRDRCVLPIGLS